MQNSEEPHSEPRGEPKEHGDHSNYPGAKGGFSSVFSGFVAATHRGGGGSGDRDTTAAVDVAGAIASHRIIGILDVLRHLIG